MCNRYAISTPVDVVIDLFGAIRSVDIASPGTVRPTNRAPVVREEEDGSRRVLGMRWWLVPPWAKDLGSLPLMTNARAETAATKPAFRGPLQRRRCVVPADHYVEWQTPEGWKKGQRKPEFHFARRDGALLAMAGLWERWVDRASGEALESFAILTCDPCAPVREVHDRMPVVLEAADWDRWLDPTVGSDGVLDLLRPAADDVLVATRAG